jgi:4-oxalocrotonate tautomerase/trans-3-chloroacrylic acid dehalogenase beta subunit
MPFIQVNVPVTLTPESKEQLIRDVITRTHEAVGSDPAIINVVVHEVPRPNMAVAGTVHSA